ncbi:MAG: hypothetical protein ABIV48_08245 [Pyrinomonadaceae bacterium]
MKLLEAFEVDYLLVGRYAVGYYGYPRPTGDIDIWISRSSEKVAKVKKSQKGQAFNAVLN